jgi:hypothetical protein
MLLCHGLAPWYLRLLLSLRGCRPEMPRPRPVELFTLFPVHLFESIHSA